MKTVRGAALLYPKKVKTVRGAALNPHKSENGPGSGPEPKKSETVRGAARHRLPLVRMGSPLKKVAQGCNRRPPIAPARPQKEPS